MALINCPECRAQVSDAAPACIKCGFPFGKIADPPRRAGILQGPRFDGIYVSQDVSKSRGNLRAFRADYMRGYIRFFQDGLVIHDAGIVKPNREPAPFPPIHRSWGTEDHRLKWSSDDGRLRIVFTSGFVSYAKLDGNRLDWEGDGHWLFDFYENEWPDS